MKLIHLSDLHLGKRINEFSMLEDQEFILNRILKIAGEEKPDGVIVAGDVYDRSVPAEEAMGLWDDFLISLSEMHVPVYAISGNHDSARRFADHGRLVSSSGIYLAPEYDGTVTSVEARDEYGIIRIWLLPFVKPAQVRRFFPDEEINDYTDACRAAISQMTIDTSCRNVLVAHQFVTGAVRCESEEIVVGGLDNVDASVFDDFDYVALGHIHGSQSIVRDTVRYCGTPLKYSLSEKDHVKSVTVVELAGKGSVSIRPVPLVPRHDLREIRGTYEELTARKNYEGTATDDYIYAVLTDENDITDAMAKLRIIYPNLMKIRYDNARTREQRDLTEGGNAERLSPMEIFEEFYEKQNNQPMTEEQRELVSDLIVSVWEEGR